MADNTSTTQHITRLDFDITKAEQQLDEIMDKFNRITNEINNKNWSISDVLNGGGELGRLNSELQSLTNQYNAARQEIIQMRQEMQAMSEQGVSSTSNLAAVIQYKLVNALEEAGRAAYDAVKSTEDSMTDISRVLGLTASQAEEMRGQMFGLGQDFGRSFDDVSAVVLRFAQAGNDMHDSIEMSRAALLALNTAELDVENGTQSLIGIISQWGMEASELTTIIDKLNYTADNNAVTTQDLVDGLLKASSMAKTAGMSFDDTVGVLTAMKVASGAAGKEVGNAFKSIMAYIQRPESLKLFDSMGIDVFKDKATGELLPMMEILENMTQKWNTSQEAMLDTLIESGDALQMMSEEWAIATDSMAEYTDYQNAMAEATDKANTAEARAQAQAAAGVYRRNYYIALMENFIDATEISKDLINAEGHSMEENSRYMETLTAKTEQLIVALTELAVTAADAGFLDTAKSAIELATAFTKWTVSTKTLLPLLASLGGIMVTLNQNRIADSLHSAGEALKNMKSAAKGAATGVTAMSGAIGIAGIAISGITLAITAVISSMKKAREEIRKLKEEAIEQGKTDKEHYDTLNDLIEKYEEYSGKVSYTEEEKENLRSLTEQLTEMYGFEADGIDLVNGKYDEQIAKLKELSAEKLNELENSQQAALNASEEKISNPYNTEKYKGNLHKDDKNALAENAINEYINDRWGNGGITALNFTIDIFDNVTGIQLQQTEEGLAAAAEMMDNLKDKGLENTDAFTLLNAAYTELAEKIDGVKQASDALAKTKLKKYIDEEANAVENLTLKSFTEWENGLLKLANDDKYLYESLKKTSTAIKTDLISKELPELSKEYSTTYHELEILAESGKLTASTFQYTAAAHNGFNDELKKSGVTVNELVDYLNGLYGTTKNTSDGMGELGNSTGMSEKELEKLSKAITDAESSITNLNKYIETLNEGNGLTAQQVLELCDTYGLLLEQFTLTEDGYKIETSALEQLRNAQIEAAVASRNSQIEQTKVLQTGVLERIKAYGIEISSIASLAEAENALLELEKKRNETYNGISSRADFEEAEAKYNSDEYNGLVDSIKEIADAYKNTEGLAEDFYKNLGKSFEETKKTSKETVDILKEVTEGFEHLASMGIYTTEEQIAYYEDLRRTLSLTEEQYKSLESTLHKLYKTQLEESKEAIKEEYEARKQAIEDQYDLDKEALEKKLDEEKEAREQYWKDELDNLKANLNAQIKAAKAAYEQKKKLADKSYNNQLEALENLRDNELDNIKAVYDAQISALEKIKAARQAERDEEDYQDERAELLEQISYYEQRTGTDAVEQLERLRKELADLDKQRAREREDEEIDNKISSLKDQRDSEISDAEKYYKSRIEALKAAQETELEIYEDTYKQEIELLENRLDSETKAMQKKRDEDLKQLDEQQKKKLKDLEDAKNAAIKAEEDKWKEIQKIFEDNNLALVASAGEFAPKLYDKFHNLFTKKFEMDLEDLKKLMQELESERSSFTLKSGTKPTTTVAKSVTSSAKNKPETSSGGFSVGTRVKVSGTVYGDSYGESPGKSLNSEKTTITQINSKGSKPYHVGSLGWVDSSQLVKARTGGKTTADGIAMLHKDELIINPPVTKMLEDLLERLSPVPKLDIEAQNDAIFRYWGNEFGKSQKAMYNAVSNNNTYNNRTNNSYSNDNSKQVVNNTNINVNAPLQNIEKVEDNADMQAAVNALERDIMRQVSSML